MVTRHHHHHDPPLCVAQAQVLTVHTLNLYFILGRISTEDSSLLQPGPALLLHGPMILHNILRLGPPGDEQSC